MAESEHATTLRPYAGEEHRPFTWAGGPNAALLIHGFPGTPAEMQPIGRALRDNGWTVQGLLLPGFGPGIAELSRYRHADWLAAVLDSLAALRLAHDKVVLVGNSFGAALSLIAAAQSEVAGLVLFAPFWRADSALVDTFFPLIRLLKRELRPFEDADFDDPELRESVSRFLPDVDFDDADVQDALRSLSLPMSTLGEVRKTGRIAYRSAPDVSQKTLVFQGAGDEVARPHLARALARRLPNLAGYVEVAGAHDLVNGNSAAGDAVLSLTNRFLESLAGDQQG
jgi:carboxylesterase